MDNSVYRGLTNTEHILQVVHLHFNATDTMWIQDKKRDKKELKSVRRGR